MDGRIDRRIDGQYVRYGEDEMKIQNDGTGITNKVKQHMDTKIDKMQNDE